MKEMKPLTEEEMALWERVNALMAEKPESMWDPKYVAKTLGEKKGAVTEIMEKTELLKEEEEKKA